MPKTSRVAKDRGAGGARPPTIPSAPTAKSPTVPATRALALLRAVNLGPHQAVTMARLVRAGERAGFGHVQSWLQSGNLVFTDPRGRDSGTLEAVLERLVLDEFKFSTPVLVRTAAEWAAALRANPFTAYAQGEPSRLVVLALRSAAREEAEAEIRSIIRGREEVRVFGRHAFAIYPEGQGRSKLTLRLLESRLGCPATARNWNTATKLAELLGPG